MPAKKIQSTVRHASAAHIPKAAQAPKANRLVIAVRSVCQRLGTGLATAAPLIALSTIPNIAQADAVIHVTPSAAGVNNGDGCSLVEAIVNANNNAAIFSECTAGSGADTIVLAGNTYSYDTAFGATYGGTQSALPFITSDITIEGNGATIQRTNGNMRILDIGQAGNLTLNSSVITGGNSDSRGGGILNSATLTINDSTISNNQAATWGGGVYNFGDGSLTVNSSTISGNTAIESGGIESAGGMLTINNSTVTGNSVTGPGGGGVYLWNGATATLNRTIVAGNSAAAGAEIYLQNGTLNLNNSNVLGHSGLTNALAFAGFTPPAGSDVIATSNGGQSTALTSILNTTLADNDGPTPTHALVSGSPAIDLISTTDPNCNPGSTFDQRGAPRASGINAGGSACDAGAFEFNSVVFSIYTVTAAPGAGNGTITPPSQDVIEGSDATFEVIPSTGWSVDTVTGDFCAPEPSIGNEWVAENITQACAVTANFSQDTFNVTTTVAAGQGDITPPSQNVAFGGTAGFTVTPDIGWSVDDVIGDSCTPASVGGTAWEATNIQDICAVEASFVINSYTVTAETGAGEGSINPGSQDVDHGSDATFTVIPDTGWSVTSVTGDTCDPLLDSGDQWVAADITQACAVTANFAEDSFELTADVVAGEGSISPATQNVVFDGTASFIVEPDTGWSIDSVVGDPCNPAPTSGDEWQATNIQANCSVEASFVINSYTVTADVGAGEGSIDPGSQNVEHGSDATFTVTPDTGWSVTTVTGDSCNPLLDSGVQWIAAGITEACAVTANFAEDTFTIGGTVSGLAGAGLVLKNNDGDDLAIDEDGDFTFAAELVDGSDYNVTVPSQPTSPSQTCIVTNGEGTLAGSNVTDIVVNCTTNSFTVGGNLTGLALGSSVTLQNNGGDDLIISTNGDFTFTTALDDLNDYAVTIASQPTGQSCSIENGAGTLAGANVENVAVACVTLELGLSLNGIQFADLDPGETDEQTLVLTNIGPVNLVIETFGAPGAPFGFSAGDCTPLPLTLGPDESCTVMLSFTPTSGGTFDDQLSIVSNAPSSPNQIGLSGSSARPPIPVPTLGPLALLLLTLSMLVLGIRLTRA